MSEEDNEYICNRCDFRCETKARWNAHIKTELHITGKKKRRSDYKEPFKCDNDDCNYETKNAVTMKIHKLNKHSSKQIKEQEFTHYCKNCDYGSFSEDSFNIHIKTIKHKYHELKEIM